MSASPELGSCSFSIAAMAIMLNGIEALGSFLRPDISGRDKNKKRFQAFLSQYMSNWTASVPALGKTLDVAEILWTHFRNGIAHGFYIERPGSLEFLKERRFEYDGEVLRVCPQHFFHDLDRGVATYFASLEGEVDVLRRFRERFDVVHPN
jgi:hypothetical protein